MYQNVLFFALGELEPPLFERSVALLANTLAEDMNAHLWIVKQIRNDMCKLMTMYTYPSQTSCAQECEIRGEYQVDDALNTTRT